LFKKLPKNSYIKIGNKENIEIIAANQNLIKNEGSIFVDLSLGKAEPLKFKLLIIKNLSVPLLLGSDFISKVEKVDNVNKLLIINEEMKIPFKNYEEFENLSKKPEVTVEKCQNSQNKDQLPHEVRKKMNYRIYKKKSWRNY